MPYYPQLTFNPMPIYFIFSCSFERWIDILISLDIPHCFFKAMRPAVKAGCDIYLEGQLIVSSLDDLSALQQFKNTLDTFFKEEAKSHYLSFLSGVPECVNLKTP